MWDGTNERPYKSHSGILVFTLKNFKCLTHTLL